MAEEFAGRTGYKGDDDGGASEEADGGEVLQPNR